MDFEEIKEYLPFLIPLAALQLGLMIAAIVSIFKHTKYKTGSRALWVVLCLCISIIGPILYFAFGKEES
ncbi:MAG: PLDc_N domain-containing protein [Ruminococcus sp.]|nr:PLDc_N domain-containing protein [Ruminococcus sp.]